MTTEPCTEASIAEAADGLVIVDGKCGMVATLTPDAAITMSDRLLEAAALAAGQQSVAEVARTGR